MTVTINGTTGIAGTNGSAGTPAVQGEDTNTGIFFPAADTVAVATAGAERLRVDSSGNGGIGVTPSYKLDAFGSVRLKTGATGTPVIISTGSDSQGTLRFGSASTEYSINGGADYLALVFNTNSAERARIDSSGNLLVGQTNSGVATSPGRGVTIGWDGEVYATFNTSGAKNTYHLYNNNATNNGFRFYVKVNGGVANFSANNENLSDERVKTDIVPLGSYWDKIKAVQVVTYKYRDQDHDDDNIGVIAQQVESVAPEFVSNDGFGETPEDGVPLKSIYEADLHYATLKALQEAMARIEELTARIAILEAK